MLDQFASCLDPQQDLVTNMRRAHPDFTENDARAALARFAFRNKDGLKRPSELSGGERMRAGLALAVSGPVTPQLLILDEPTNHLDIPSLATLEAALRDYDGALLIVSHDRRFLQAVGITHSIDLGQ